ncbi:MAG: hypothetical protein RLZZ455_1219 [Candidatus Parcubacteria bacterium]|jgi:S-DNA-T family DNA segregation ATPase FtsK/SpoIIIE
MRTKRKATRRKRSTKFKLKKNTIYNIFAVGSFLLSVLLFLSFTKSGDSMIIINDMLSGSFGGFSIVIPLFLVFLGLFFLRLKSYISRPNVSIGFLLATVSLMSLFRTGVFGTRMYQILSEILTVPGAGIVFIAGAIIGTIVFFDTSVDEILKAVGVMGKNIPRLLPIGTLGGLKKSQLGSQEGVFDRNKPMTIKGGAKDQSMQNGKPQGIPIVNKKDPELLSAKLVSNAIAGADGVWEYPPLSLLNEAPGQKADRGDINKIASIIEKTLQSFGVEARVAEVNLGPAVTQYALEIALGTKVSKITSLANDLALATEAPTGQIRIEAPIPGRNLVGIEIPNRSLEVVTLRTMLASSVMQKAKSKLSASLGLDVSGSAVIADISKMPHMLVAGTTGSGKSVLINAFITSLLFRASPSEVKFILVDPKRVEFTGYNGIPHLLTPVIVEPEKILSALKWGMGEMDRRYKLFAERGVRNIDGYNELSGFQALPYIVIIVDELADLMMFAPVEVEDAIARLAQMARATGIHLIIATQRPSVNVITGLIKANIPARIAFNVSSMIDSRVILDTPGAEKLLGRGDMLYIPPDQAKPTRIQGAFVSEKEVKKLVDFLKAKNIPLEYTEEVLTQPLPLKKGSGAGGSSAGTDGKDAQLEEVIRIVCQFNTASASFLQRKMSIGYSRAARILDQLEEMGIVGPAEGSKPREVLVRNAEEFLSQQQQ